MAGLSEGPGTKIGRYKLLQKIGGGGMGVVYMAEQTEPVTRRVALKIIKLGMDTKQVVARFEAERQALAMMDHPDIARVLDGGATGAKGAESQISNLKSQISNSCGLPVLRDGTRARPPHHRVLRQEQTFGQGAFEIVHSRLPSNPERPSEGHHSPRHQTIERSGHSESRDANPKSHRPRHC